MSGPTRGAGLVALLSLLGCSGGSGGGTDGKAVVRQGLGNAPDFTVTVLNAPNSTYPGNMFQATVEVCNRGDVAGGTELGLFLSDDAAIQPTSDLWSGDFYVGWLEAGQCQRQLLPVDTTMLPWQGAWYLGAVADPYESQWEGDETNNAQTHGPMGIGYGPDFRIKSITAPASLRPGDFLTTRVQVCNQGTEPGGTDLEVYLSADTIVQPGAPDDVLLGTSSTGLLYPGQCSFVSTWGNVSLPPPGVEGPHYLGAAVNPYGYQSELVVDNNIEVPHRLGVGVRPDFLVKSVTGPSSVQADQSLSGQVTVCNQGTEPGSTQVEVYLSADTFLQPGPGEDSLVGGSFPTGHLFPGQCSTLPFWGSATLPFPGAEGAWYLGAVVDPSDNQAELIADNNANAGYLLGVGNAPDFVIKSVTGPSSVMPGQQLTAQVQVCNQGTASGSTEVELWLSADTHFRAPGPSSSPLQDTWVGMAPTGHLYPGQCATVPVWGNANLPPPGMEGAYHLGAVVDPMDNRLELIADNNVHAGYRIGVGGWSDFVIKSVTGPASAIPGQPITAQVTVCNQGTQPDNTEVEVYLSADTTFLTPGPWTPWGEQMVDVLVGTAPTGPVFPGQCVTVPVNGPAERPYSNSPSSSYEPESAYHLGAVVDPYDNRMELIADNNTHTGYRMGVGDRPDFIVKSVTGPASAIPGQPITAQVTVCNQGTQPDNTEVEVYLSADTTFRTPGYSMPWGEQMVDVLVGTAPTGPVFPGQCVTVPVNGSAERPYSGSPYSPSYEPENAYHLGAVVDPMDSRMELIADNNTNPGYRMGVGERPDFIVKSVTGPASAIPGQPITAQVTVCNQGTQPDSTEVEVYLSADTTFRTPGYSMPWGEQMFDWLVGMAPTGPVFPGQCVTVPVNGSAERPYSSSPYSPSYEPENAYHLGAVVDPMDNRMELIATNNTNPGYRMGLGDRPDFVIKSVTGPASAIPGQPITAQVTVCNQGTQPDNTEVEVYLSADTTFRTPGPWTPSNGPILDAFVGMAPTGPVYPGQCVTVPVNGSAERPYSNSPSSSYEPENAYHLGAVVDPMDSRMELIADNNTNPGYRMGLGDRPDFIIKSVTGPASAIPGQPITAQVTVCNQGTQPDNTEVEVYLSADTTFRTPGPWSPSNGPILDSFVGMAPTGPVYPGQCVTVPVNGSAERPYSYYPQPSPELENAYHLGAVVDPMDSRLELIADNNTHTGYRMGLGDRADFVIKSVTGPASAIPGQPITAQVTVCNQGTQPDSTEVEVYLSADATFRTPGPWNSSSGPMLDDIVGMAPTGPVYPGQCVTVPVNGSADLPPPPNTPHPPSDVERAYHLGAVVDPYDNRMELIADNNTHAGYRMGLGDRADFVIKSVTGPASAIPGQPITAQVTVCNQGTQLDSTEVEVYLSADTTFRTPGPWTPSSGPMLDSFVGMAPTGPLYPGQCVTVPVNGPAEPPPPPNTPYPPSDMERAYYLGAVVDPMDTRMELIADNNTNPGYRMGLGTRPDFVIKSVTGPASAIPGQPITAQVTVCNQGTQLDNTEVEVYLSRDTTFRAPGPWGPWSGPMEDMPVGMAPTGPLYPGQCVTVPVNGYADAPPPPNTPYPPSDVERAYYLGAVVDPMDTRLEFLADNNINPGYRMGLGERPDFVIKSVTGPVSAQPGQQVTTQVTVCNQGTQLDNTEVEVYLSADTTFRTPGPWSPNMPPMFDVPLGMAPTGPVYPGHCVTVSVTGIADRPMSPSPQPSPELEQAYHVGAVVDPMDTRLELIADNNTHVGYRMGLGTRPDFIVSAVSGPASVLPGNTFTGSVTFCNRGQASGSTDVELYLSRDTTIRVPTGPMPPEDYFLGRTSVVTLGVNQCVTRSLTMTAPTGMNGGYYLGAVVDPLNTRPELLEDNNAKAFNRIGVGPEADFLINTVTTGSSSVKPGNSFTASVSVCNRGQLADTTDVHLFLTADETIRRSIDPNLVEDYYLGTISGVALSVGQCLSRSLTVTVPTSVKEGVYYVGAIADPNLNRPEIIEDNNDKVGSRIGVGSQADFQISAVTGPTTVVRGASFSASVTLCNRGQLSASAPVDIVLSADTTIRAPGPMQPPEDFYLGTLPSVTLGINQCITRSLPVSANVPTSGNYYLGAVADPQGQQVEFFEENNTRAGTLMSVTP
jgi:subtilase family serine protease